MSKPKLAEQQKHDETPANAKEMSENGGSDHLQRASGSEASANNDSFHEQVLADFDYIQLKEKKVKLEPNTPYIPAISFQQSIAKPKLSKSGERLLGILGHCSLPGHIAHFYNLQFEIERHIKTVDDFDNPKFVEAYKYLKAMPSTEAVFIYEHKMVAANRVNGRLIQKEIISG